MWIICYNYIVRPNKVPKHTLKKRSVSVMESNLKNTLCGPTISNEMMVELNGTLAGGALLVDATAMVCGTSNADAYLSVEMVMSGLEMTPMYATFALPGSHSKCDGRINKNFSDVAPDVRNIICNYWRSIAATLTFRGNGLSIEESRK